MWTRRAPRRPRSRAGYRLRFRGTRSQTLGSPGCPLPRVPGPAPPRALGGAPRQDQMTLPASLRRGPDRVPRPHSPSPGLGRAAPPTSGRWGFGGAARISRPQPCPAPFAELCQAPLGTLQSAARVSGPACPPGCRVCPARLRGAGRMAGDSGDERPRAGSFIADRSSWSPSWAAASSRPPPGVLAHSSQGGGGGSARDGVGSFRLALGIHDARLLLGRPRGAPPPHPPLPSLRPWLARVPRESAGGTRGDAAPRRGGRKGRPAGLAGTSRGHPDPALHPQPEQQRS